MSEQTLAHVLKIVGAKDAEIAALKAEVERLEEVKRTMFCLYCGKDFYHYTGAFPPSKEEAAVAYRECFDHDKTCPDNPIVKALAAAEAVVEKVREWRTSVWDYNPKGKDVCIEVDYEDWVALKIIIGEGEKPFNVQDFISDMHADREDT